MAQRRSGFLWFPWPLVKGSVLRSYHGLFWYSAILVWHIAVMYRGSLATICVYTPCIPCSRSSACFTISLLHYPLLPDPVLGDTLFCQLLARFCTIFVALSMAVLLHDSLHHCIAVPCVATPYALLIYHSLSYSLLWHRLASD